MREDDHDIKYSMDAQTIATYNDMAKEYDDETIDFWERFPVGFVDEFCKNVQGKILDVGSGPGRDGVILKNRGLDVTCIDASESMVAICKERGLEAIVGDFAALPFEDGAFDGVWAYTSLLHVPKAEVGDSIEEIRRVLKDGGVFALGLIEGDLEGYRESSGVASSRWVSFYTVEEVQSLLKAHGFDVIHFETFTPRTKRYLNFLARKV